MVCYPVPFDKITASICPEAKLRKLVRNMVYVGVVSQLLSIDLAVVESGLRKQFSKKQKVFDLNFGAVKAGFEYAQENFTKQDPYTIERMDETEGKIIIDGNAACGMGAVFAGVTVVAWYPITPSTSMIEATTDLLKKFRVTPEGKATFAVVQAEDELAAIGMVLGAGWAGARSMTATSGPGISLMAEFAGLGYYAEIPGVIFDVQRTGPSTGMPTRTQQSDLLTVAFLSHGDTKHIVLLPGSVKECFELGYAAFDLAERLQTPVFVLSDLDLGMNNWMSEPFDYPDKPLDRGKVLTAEDLNRLGGFARYRDVDGDAIGWRTLPGTMHPKAAYFTRGSGHNDAAGYTEKPDEYVERDGAAVAQVRECAQAGSRPGDGEGWKLEGGFPGLWHHRLCAPREPGPDQEGIRPGCGLHAHPRVSFCARDSRLCGFARARLCGGAEPRRAVGQPAEAGSSRRSGGETAQHSALQRIAGGRSIHYRGICDQGGPLNGNRYPKRLKSTISAFRFLSIAAARARSVPAAATTPSPSASSTPCSRWAWSRSG